MSLSSENQRYFREYCLQAIPGTQDRYFGVKKSHKKIKNIDNLSTGIDMTIASIGLVGLIIATTPITFGGSLAGVAAAIVLYKGTEAIIGQVGSYLESLHESTGPLKLSDVFELERKIQTAILNRAVFLCMVRYQYILNHLLTPDGIKAFAEYITSHLFEALQSILAEPKLAPFDVDKFLTTLPHQLVDHLMEKSGLSFLSSADTVTLKGVKHGLRLMYYDKVALPTLAKHARWLMLMPAGHLEVWASESERSLFEPTTIEDLGVIVMDSSYHGYLGGNRARVEVDKKSFAIDTHKMTRRKILSHVEQELWTQLIFPFEVTAEIIDAYLTWVRGMRFNQVKEEVIPDLNTYLSNTYHKNYYAACHGNQLRHKDLSGGKYHSVDFFGADLEECVLCDTEWLNGSILTSAKLRKVKMNANTNLQGVYAEFSRWTEVSVMGNFANGKFHMAVFDTCELNTEWITFGMACDGVTYPGTKPKDTMQSLLFYLQNWTQRINDELHSERVERKLEHDRLSAKAEDLAVDLAELQKSELEHWQVSEKKDSQFEEGLKEFQKRLGPAYTVQCYWQNNFNGESHRREKGMYIPLHALSGSTFSDKVSLLQAIDSFLEQETSLVNPSIALLSGLKGSGMSLTLRLMVENLLLNYRSQVDLLPIYIDFNIHSTAEFSLYRALSHLFDNVQQHDLSQKYTCVLIFDHYDEHDVTIRDIVDEIFDKCPNWAIQPKVIIATNLNQLALETEEYTEIQPKITTEWKILPLEEADILQYMNFYKLGHVFVEKNYSHLKWNEALWEIGCSPAMLSITATILSDPSVQLDKLTLLEYLEKYWVIAHKLNRPRLSVEYHKFQTFIQAVSEFAIAIYEQEGDEWVYKPEEQKIYQKIALTPIVELFLNKRLSNFPLKVARKDNMLHWYFEPKILGSSLVAGLLFACLKNNQMSAEALKLWNMRYLTATPDVLNRLIEYIRRSITSQKDQEDIYLHLEKWLFYAKNHKLNPLAMSKLTSNAFTLLSRLGGYLFSNQDYSALVMPHVQGVEGTYIRTQFKGSDLQGGWFPRTVMFAAGLENTNLLGVHFTYTIPRLIPTEYSITKFTYLIVKGVPMIAYSTDRHPAAITVIQLEGNKSKRRYLLHQQEINAIASSGSLLASAGNGGMVRIMDLSKSDADNVVAWFCSLTHKKPFFHLTFGPPGYITAVDSDQYLRMWNYQSKNKIGKIKINFQVRAFLWTDNLFIAGGKSTDLWIGTIENWESSKPVVQARYIHLGALLKAQLPSDILSLAISSTGELAIGFQSGKIVAIRLKPYIEHMKSNVDINVDAKWYFRHRNPVCSLTWIDSHTLVSNSWDITYIWRNSHKATSLKNDFPISTLLTLPDKRLLAGGGSSYLQIHQVIEKMSVLESEGLESDLLGLVYCLAMQPASAIEQHVAVGFEDGTILVYPVSDIQGSISIPHLSQQVFKHREGVKYISWSQSGNYIASIGTDGEVCFIDFHSNPMYTETLEPPLGTLFQALEWQNDLLLLGTSDGLVYLYEQIVDDSTMGPQWGLVASTTADSLYKGAIAVNSIATRQTSSDSIISFAASKNHWIEIWTSDKQTCKLITSFYHPQSEHFYLSWSLCGDFLAARSKRSLKIWRTRDFECIYTLDRRGSNTVDFLSFIWVENKLIVGTKDQLLIWNFEHYSGTLMHPQEVPLGAPLIAKGKATFVIAENRGIFLFDEVKLLNLAHTHALISVLKADLYLRFCRISGAKLDASDKVFMLNHGAIDESAATIKLPTASNTIAVRIDSAPHSPMPSPTETEKGGSILSMFSIRRGHSSSPVLEFRSSGSGSDTHSQPGLWLDSPKSQYK